MVKKLKLDSEDLKRAYVLYAFKFGDFYYIGKTGSSNQPNPKSVLERLGRHLAPVGKTKSSIWKEDKTLQRYIKNAKSFEFFYEKMPVQSKARSIKTESLAILEGKEEFGKFLLNKENRNAKVRDEVSKEETRFVLRFLKSIK